MRRRRLLALGTTATASLAGCVGYIGEVNDEVEDEVEDTVPAKPMPAQSADTSPNIGGTLNGRPHRLNDDLALIGKSNTTWMHAFLDVRGKYEQNVSPRGDPDVRALRRTAGKKGTKLIVSLRWDFIGIWGDKEAKNVPSAGTSREATLFEYATKLLEAIGQPVDVIVLGNEPIWETPDEDVTGSDAPLVPFTRRLKDHLVQNYTEDTRLLLGAFNRLYDSEVWWEYQHFYRQLFDLARSDDDIDGIDLHIHYGDLGEAEEMLSDAREAVPDGMIIATEFSPMWRYERNTDEPIDGFNGGDRFADRYGLPGGMTVREYFEAAKDDPRPRGEMAAFMEVMPWYNINFVEDMHNLLAEYNADVGTIGFLQDIGIRNTEWASDWRPFTINYLFQRGLIDSPNGSHPHYIDDYRERS